MSRPRVLIAEDQAIVAMELEHRLQVLGYDVCGLVASAEDAIASARATTPDVLLFDIRLRGASDGIEAAKTIQSAAPVPVVFLSAYADRPMLERVRALDHSSYMLKPFDERMLQISLDAAIHKFRVSTERDREERARHRSEARLAALLDHSPDAIVSVDRNLRVVVFNRGAERVFQYGAHEVLGEPIDRLLPATDWAAYSRAAEGTTAGNHAELEGRRKDGDRFPAEATLFRVDHEDETLFSLILRDISDRKRLEARTVQAQKLEAVGRLAAGVVHDFNNLLSVIQCHAYLAAVHATPASMRSIEEIQAGIHRGAALTRTLLAFVRRQPTLPQPIDVSVAVASMEGLVRTLCGTDVDLRLELEVGAGVAAIDRSGLEQVVMNLVVNARDAMPGGGPLVVRTRRRDVRESHTSLLGPIPAGPYAEVSVRDYGTGIAPDVAERILEPFFTTKPLGRGTGLGLMTVADVLRAHEAHLELESEPGCGSTFRVLFRALEGVVLHAPSESAPAPLPVETTSIRVLVVDDDDALRAAALQLLTLQGFVALEARSPEEALLLARETEHLDVVLADVWMPTMTGPTLLQEIRRIRPEVEGLLMTADPDTAQAELRRTGEHALLLIKPFLAVELFTQVKLVAETGKAERRA